MFNFLKFGQQRGEKAGFSVVEMIVAAFIFSIIMTVSVAASLSIVRANRQAQSIKSVVSNFSYAIESMVRNLRIGSNYKCGSTFPYNCPISGSGATAITFDDYNGENSGYRLRNSSIERLVQGGYVTITSQDVVIDYLRFYVDGNGKNNKQPNVLILVKGHVSFNNQPTIFTLETMATQRQVDGAESD